MEPFEFPDSGVCGCIIGQGQFFCLRPTPCIKKSHRDNQVDIYAKSGHVYIPTSGRAPQAFCYPFLDSDEVSSDVISTVVSMAWLPSKLKELFTRLAEDPTAMDSTQVLDFLRDVSNEEFRAKANAAMTPTKPRAPTDDDDADDGGEIPLPAVYVELLSTFDKQAIAKLETLEDGDTPPTKENFNSLSIATTNLRDLLLQTIGLGEMVSQELVMVQKLANATSLRLLSSVGEDPGIGNHEDVEKFTSAWEGLEYLSNKLGEVTHDVTVAKRDNQTVARTVQSELEKFKDKTEQWDNDFTRRLALLAGPELHTRVKGLVMDAVEDLLGGNIQEGAMQFDNDAGGNNVDLEEVNMIGGSGGRGRNAGDPVNDGHGALMEVTGGNNNVHVDLSLQAEIARMNDVLKEVQVDMEYLKSVTSTGSIRFDLVMLEFDSEKSLLDYLTRLHAKVALPDDLHVFCLDVWAGMDYACVTLDGEERQASDAQIAKQLEAAQKAKFNSKESLSRYAGFHRHLPLLVEPKNTSVTSDVVTDALPGLKKYADLDNRGAGKPGRRQQVADEFKSHLSSTKKSVRDVFKNPELRDLREFLEATITTTQSHYQLFWEWAKATYDDEKGSSSESEAWSLVAGYIRAIFHDVRDARLVGRSTAGLKGLRKDARLIWAMGMGAMKFQEFVDVQFDAHPSCVAVHTQFMTRARTPLSTFRTLEQKVKTMNGEITKLQGTVAQLRARGGGGRNNNNNGGGGGAAGNPDTP